MITTFEGRMGQGKTLAMTGLAVQHRTTELVNCLEKAKKLEPGTLGYNHFQDNLTFPEYVRALEADWSLVEQELVETRNKIQVGEEPPLDWELRQNLRVVKIFSNYHLAFIKYDYVDLPKFADIVQRAETGELILHNALFLLDEMYLWLDSRLSSSKTNRLVNAFVVQTRKRGIDLYGTTHTLQRIDKRFRGAVDIKASCRFEGSTQTCRIRFRDMHTGRKTIKLLHGPPIYPFFDTAEIVKPQGKPYRLTQEYAT